MGKALSIKMFPFFIDNRKMRNKSKCQILYEWLIMYVRSNWWDYADVGNVAYKY